mmetsp:Transcript_29142/g.44062  ORF Transcript_29142/g.44062 Transcript_29142/m.44062 type:complete len:160 (+) Transcript_29142:256-735(+)
MLSLLKFQRSSLTLGVASDKFGQFAKLLPLNQFSGLFSMRPFSTELNEAFAHMSDDELKDTSTIPGWKYVHSPPREVPRGALVGTVVSTKMDKTVNVAVNRYHIVPKYRKRRVYTRKFMAHDEKEVADKGDLVMIVPCQRISRHKHFMLREIIKPKGKL